MVATASVGDRITPRLKTISRRARRRRARGAMMHSGDDALPYMDKAFPDAWKAAFSRLLSPRRPPSTG